MNGGKPIKIEFFVGNIIKLCPPDSLYRNRLRKTLAKVETRPDKDYIYERVDYYNKMNSVVELPAESINEHHRVNYRYVGPLNGFTFSMFHSAYYFDSKEFTRWFNPSLRFGYYPGDVYFTPDFPAIVKSRLLANDNHNSVVLKLDKFRHFIFLNDPKPFHKKKNVAIFRGKIRESRDRRGFLEQYINHPMFDCGIVGKPHGSPEEWIVPKISLKKHLDYKFIMTLEGNDVASNLKWVMSTNSIAVMPKPTCETWFMEGKLIPDYHYIDVKPDFSDIVEKLQYYAENPQKAQEIIDHAHEFVDQFRDKERETLISLLVLKKYFEMTGQG